MKKEIEKNNISAVSVLSGNRNFEGRIHKSIKSNYLSSPPLVIAYALMGNVTNNIKEFIFAEKDGKKYKLSDLWPSNNEIEQYMLKTSFQSIYAEKYKDIYSGGKMWDDLSSTASESFSWDEKSTYIENPPFFDDKENITTIKDAKCLLLLGDSITTDHISPAGSIKETSAAGKYLISKGVPQEQFNSYGSRRGSNSVMTRGTFANIRIKNEAIEESGPLALNQINNTIDKCIQRCRRIRKKAISTK